MPVKGEADYRLEASEVNSGSLAVVTVVHGLPPRSLGGTEVAALRLAKALAPQVQTTFFYPGAPGPSGLRRDGLRPIERAEVSTSKEPPKRFADTLRRVDVEAAFTALLKGGAPGTGRPFDLCHVHHLTHLSLGLIHIAKAQGLPVILTLHDYWLACARGQLMDLDFQPCPGPSLKGCSRCLGDQLAIGSPRARIGGALRRLMAPPKQSTTSPTSEKRPPAAPAPKDALAGVYQSMESLALSLIPPPKAGQRALEQRFELAHQIFDLADVILSPSADLLERFIKMGLLKVPSKGQVLGNIPPSPGPPAEPPPAPPLRLIYVGSVIPTKGVHTLIDALAHQAPASVTLDILGPTPPFHRAPTYGADLQAKATPGVRWLGPLPPEEVGAHIAKAHALVLPSIWPENAPVTLREALIQGVPVIASRIGGIPEVVAEGVNGLLFEAGDVMDLAQAIHKMADDDLREALGRGARQTHQEAIGAGPEEWRALYHHCRSLVE